MIGNHPRVSAEHSAGVEVIGVKDDDDKSNMSTQKANNLAV